MYVHLEAPCMCSLCAAVTAEAADELGEGQQFDEADGEGHSLLLFPKPPCIVMHVSALSFRHIIYTDGCLACAYWASTAVWS